MTAESNFIQQEVTLSWAVCSLGLLYGLLLLPHSFVQAIRSISKYHHIVQNRLIQRSIPTYNKLWSCTRAPNAHDAISQQYSMNKELLLRHPLESDASTLDEKSNFAQEYNSACLFESALRKKLQCFICWQICDKHKFKCRNTSTRR